MRPCPALPANSHTHTPSGDVNIFLNDHEEPHTAEIEIMVAEPRSRRRGLAHEALGLFMAYAAAHLVRWLWGVRLGCSR